MDNITIYLSCCDKYNYILPATIYLYNKFIKPNPLIKILGFKKPELPDWDNIEFISLSEKQENINLWSNYLYNYFINIEDEYVFLALDDFFPIDNINLDCYKYVMDYMKKNPVGFCILSQEPSSDPNRNEVDEILVDNDKYFVYKRKKNVGYQLVLQPAIWNRKYLLKYLKYNCSPWDFELKLSNIANKDNNYYNISTSKYPIDNPKCLLPYNDNSSLSSKWINKISVIGLRNNIVQELIDLNLIDSNKLIIGAWGIDVKWNKNFSKKDLKILSDKVSHNNWYAKFKNYYYD